MSNATVSSQVYILRTHASLSAVNAGTMVLYSDDQHVFAQDQAGNIYNLCTPNVSNLSISLSDLDDTNIASLTADINNKIHIIRYDAGSAKWVNEDLVLRLGQLSDVLDATPNDGDALVYQASSQSFVYAPVSGTGTGDDLGNHTATEALKMGTHAIEGNTLDFRDTNSQIETANFNFMGKNITSLTPQHQPARIVLYSSDGTASTKHVSIQAQEAGSMGTSYNVKLPSAAPTANQVLAAESSISDATDVTLVWTAPTAGIGLADLSRSIAGTPTPGGNLDYDNTTGIFTFTPASTTALQFWTENSSGHIVPNTTELHSLGSADSKIKDIWLSDGLAGKLYFDATGSASASNAQDFASICTSGDASGRLDFRSHPDAVSNAHLYDFGASDNFPARVILHTGNTGATLSLQANGSSTTNQILKFPQAPGNAGAHLALDSVSGDLLSLAWMDMSESHLLRVSLNSFNFKISAGSAVGNGASHTPTVGSTDYELLGSSENWNANNSTPNNNLAVKSFFSNLFHNRGIHSQLSVETDFDIIFADNGAAWTQEPNSSSTATVKIHIQGKTLGSVVSTLAEVTLTSINFSFSGTQKILNIPKATLQTELANETGFGANGVNSNIEQIIVTVYVYDLTTAFSGNSNTELSLVHNCMTLKLEQS